MVANQLATALLLGVSLVSGSIAGPQTAYLGQAEDDFTMPSFRFRSGEVLDQLRLHYLTLGKPHRNSSGSIDNAVLLLHSTGDDTTEFLEPMFAEPLYGPGQALDLTRYYLIIPDSIGHGRSSRPSDGLRAHFPHYGYEDMVDAQHRLVTERLGVTHLRLVLGLSMGGMHTWLWGERYPETMDALLPLGSLPVETGGRNRLWRHVIVEAIRNDPEWKNGDYEQQPQIYSRLRPIVEIMIGNPTNQYKAHPTRAAADAWYQEITAQSYQHGDANDRLYQYEASSDYDPAPGLEKIQARLIAIEFADDQINSPQFFVLDREMPRVRHGRYVIIPEGKDTNGEADDIVNAKLWRAYLVEALSSSLK
jgi:homoserine O-acetyltransferase